MHSNVYSKSYIQNSLAALHQARVILRDHLLPYLVQASLTPDGCTPAIDVLELWNSTSMELVTAYLFGLKGCYNFIRDVNFRKTWLHMFISRKPFTYYKQKLPRLTRFLEIVGIRLIPRWTGEMNEKLENCTNQSCESTKFCLENQNSKSPDLEPGNEPVVFKAILSGISKEQSLKGADSPLANETLTHPGLSIASEMIDNLGAGYETSGITLTYLTWHLSQDLGLQDALWTELSTLSPNFLPSPNDGASQIPTPKDLDALPLLHAIIMETLRLNAAIPGSQPRVTPYPSCTLGQYTNIPGGVRVSARAHNLHRNADVFPEPEKWDYMRCMDHVNGMSEKSKRERDRWFWAFGSGGRMCLGSNFALHCRS